MSFIKTEVRSGVYYDSVVLMHLQRSLLDQPGVLDSGVVMGTDANKDVLAQSGLLTDNVLRPYLISRGSDLPLILILFGVVGGAVTFGLLGLFLGPTLLAVVYELVREWNAVEKHEVPFGCAE